MGPFTESIRGDLAAAGLMPDPLPGHSSVNSRGEGVDPSVTRRSAGMDPEDADFLLAGGWSVVDIRWGDEENGGLTAHRGVLHPDDYVDRDLLAALVFDRLGFTPDEVESVYRVGGMTGDQKALRSRIDARLLEVSEAGGNMLELAKALGWTISPPPPSGKGETCRKMERALARAVSARGVGGSE